MTSVTDAIALATGPGIVQMIDGAGVSATAGLVVATLRLAEGEAIQDQDLETAVDVQGPGQGIDADVPDPVTAVAEVAARVTSANPHEGSPMTAKTASPGTESRAASQGAAPDPSPNPVPGPSHEAGPQSSRMGTGMAVTWANRRMGQAARPGAIQAAPTDSASGNCCLGTGAAYIEGGR